MNELTSLKGIGPKANEKLNSLGIFSIKDLLEYYPRSYIDRSTISNVSNANETEYIALKGIITNIISKRLPYGRKLHITTASFRDKTGQIELTWFNQPYLKNILKEDITILIYGKIEKKGFFLKMNNPDFSFNEADFFTIQPIYPKNRYTTQYDIRKSVKSAFQYIDNLIVDEFPIDLREKYNLCEKKYAIKNIHFPNSSEDFQLARRRLVFEEFFIMQLALFSLKQNIKHEKTKIPFLKYKAADEFVSKLPFSLTNSQKQAITELKNDLLSGYPMNRLLQGDVGSGKTVVAFYCVMSAFSNNYQSAYMAPTEILAMQHYQTAQSLLQGLGIKTYLLTGSMKKADKEETLNKIVNGEADFVIGTHALIQDDVVFKNLGLCITDEQHRFGVAQRAILSSKGDKPHLLVMSATPIPRTLALIIYGDLDVTSITELPKNRKKVLTYSVDETYRKRINDFILKIVSLGEQVFVVCPAIYENDDIDITNVTEKYKELLDDLPGISIGILHGEMNNQQKNEVINKYLNNDIKVLVTTSIIEVGIDIPNATLIIVEDAQQFGLSQLHQLRGRVGRSDKQSYCVLFNQSESEIAKKRMDAMVNSNDGFYISQQDLLLRGPGDFFGLKQHGLPDFKIANIYEDMDLLKLSQKAVKDEMKKINLYENLIKDSINNLSKTGL